MEKKEQLAVRFIGHSTFLLHSPGGKDILIDPWIASNPSCPDEAKKIEKLDLLLITHGHGDHMPEAVSLAREHRPWIVCNFEISHWLGLKGVSERLVGMNKGGTAEVEGIKVTMVDAKHSSSIAEDDGSLTYAGEAAGYVIEFENGYRVYHAGDTSVFGDMRLIGEIYRPDLALLPIGDHFTMGPLEAAHACRLLGVKKVIPMHFSTFPVLTGRPTHLRDRVSGLGVEVIDLEPGQTLTIG